MLFFGPKRSRLVVLLLLLSLPVLTLAGELESRIAAIDSLFEQAYPGDGPGAAVLIIQGDQVLLRKGYGLADMEHFLPIKPEMVFRIGSVTKQFTSAAVMLLVEQGKISLQDELTDFLPDYPMQGHKVTVEHLLTHTSGIASYTSLPSLMERAREDLTVSEMIDVFKNEPFNFEPGTQWRYNNSGYFLLGAIIEKVSGQTYEEFLNEHIFKKLGLKHTYFDTTDRIIKDRVRGYGYAGDHWRNARYISMSLPFAAGSLISSVDDLATWVAAWNSGKLFSKQSFAQMSREYHLLNGKGTKYGYGLQINAIQGKPVIEHGGDIFGFSSDLITVPEQNLVVIALTNRAGGQPSIHGIARKATAIAIGNPFPTFSETPVDPALLAKLVGVYTVDEETDRVVTLVDGVLHTQRGNGRLMSVTPGGDDLFFYDDHMTYFRVERDKDGKVTGMRIFQGGGDTWSPRTEKPLPEMSKMVQLTPEVLANYAGKYALSPAFSIEISTRDGHIYGQGTGQPEFEMLARSETVFYIASVGAEIHFSRNESNQVDKMVLHQGGKEVPGKKIE